jgi:hypothetical protein
MSGASESKADEARQEGEARGVQVRGPQAAAQARGAARPSATAARGQEPAVSPEVRAMAQAFALAQKEVLRPAPASRTEGIDTAPVPGGVYLVNGEYVDCDGTPVPEARWPEDYETDPMWRKFHPHGKGGPPDYGPGVDQFGRPLGAEDSPTRRGRAGEG